MLIPYQIILRSCSSIMQFFAVANIPAEGSTATCQVLLNLFVVSFIDATGLCSGLTVRLLPNLLSPIQRFFPQRYVHDLVHHIRTPHVRRRNVPMAFVVMLSQDVLAVYPGSPEVNRLLYHINVVIFTSSILFVVSHTCSSVVLQNRRSIKHGFLFIATCSLRIRT